MDFLWMFYGFPNDFLTNTQLLLEFLIICNCVRAPQQTVTSCFFGRQHCKGMGLRRQSIENPSKFNRTFIGNPMKSNPTLIHLKTHIFYELNCQFYCLLLPVWALLLFPCAITTRAPLLARLLFPCGITTRSTEGLLPRPPARATISGGAALCTHRLSQGSGPGVWG